MDLFTLYLRYNKPFAMLDMCTFFHVDANIKSPGIKVNRSDSAQC